MTSQTTTPQPVDGVLPGLIVIERNWSRVAKRRAAKGFTLHRKDCSYASRSLARALPAPADHYPGTKPCPYCRPLGGDQGAESFVAKKNAPAGGRRSRTRGRHFYEYKVVDGRWFATCLVCGVAGDGASRNGARAKGYRLHREAEAAMQEVAG